MTRATFVGSFPAADFTVPAPLPEVAFLGRSNVGKSSLINAVTNTRMLARVSKTPGKTRACNVYDIDGRWYLVDLPGYGFARASHSDRAAFRNLVTTYVGKRARLAGAVWLLDVRHDPSDDDLRMGERFAARGLPVLVAVTKIDKITRTHRAGRTRDILSAVGIPADQAILTSSLSGEGIEDLRDSIAALVDSVSGSRAGPA